MSGWIKLEKDLLTDPRALRIGLKICNGLPLHGVTVVLGGLAHLWMIADTHIGDDDVIPLGADEINQVIGIQGFCELLPVDWLQVVDSHHVKLPGFHTHNGTIAKERALAARRVERHRSKGNAKPLPTVTLERNQTETKTETSFSEFTHIGNGSKSDKTASESEIRTRVDGIKDIYPTPARSDWITGEKNARNLVLNGEATWDELYAGTDRYAKHCRATGRLPLNPARFFGDIDRPWSQDWPIPQSKINGKTTSIHSSDATAWSEAKALAKEIGFRDPYAAETAISYMTQVKYARDTPPRRTISGLAELASEMRAPK